jgi:hypothetical protein
MRHAAIIYLIWAVVLASAGFYTVRKITDQKDPKSFVSRVKELNETLNEYP